MRKHYAQGYTGWKWVNTKVGGLAGYEDDYYQQVSRDIQHVPGNPRFICTMMPVAAPVPAGIDAGFRLIRINTFYCFIHTSAKFISPSGVTFSPDT